MNEIQDPSHDFHMSRSLEQRGIDRPLMDFPIEHEKTLDGEEIDADIEWVKFAKPEGMDDLPDVEGKLYSAKNSNGELILFTPGFPGGNAGRFEQRYAKVFVDNGYSFFTIRHNGTSLKNGDTSLEILNSAKRMELAEQNGESYIGGEKEGGYLPEDMIKETATPLVALEKGFNKVHLMGQSMGVASSYNALRLLKDRKEIMDKIGNVVGIAGYVGGEGEDERGTRSGMNMPMDDLVDYEVGYIHKVDGNVSTDHARLKESFAKVAEANENMTVPDHVGNILVYTPEDPLIAGPDKNEEEYALQYGPRNTRKLIIRDETSLGEPKPHSMLWIDPKNLLRAVEAKVSGHGPHYFKVPGPEKG